LPTEVRYTITKSDYGAMARHYSLDNPRWRIFAISLVLGLSLGCIGWLASATPGSLAAPLSLIGAFLLAVIAWACCVYLFLVCKISAGYRRLPSYRKTICLKLTGGGMDFEHEIGSSHVNWSSIVEIEENEKLLYLFVNRKLAFLVPKRAFPSADEAAAFVNQAREYWTEARSGA
jgi:hypothetical protein